MVYLQLGEFDIAYCYPLKRAQRGCGVNQPRSARGCISYDKQQPQHIVAISHSALRLTAADAVIY